MNHKDVREVYMAHYQEELTEEEWRELDFPPRWFGYLLILAGILGLLIGWASAPFGLVPA